MDATASVMECIEYGSGVAIVIPFPRKVFYLSLLLYLKLEYLCLRHARPPFLALPREVLKPAQQLLAYTHQMRGRIAFDRLDFAAASGHFSEMIDLGNELHDTDIITMGMVYQGSLLRKRGRFETALRCFEAAKPFADAASEPTKGIYHVNLSTVYADSGKEKPFLQAIDTALELAKDIKESIAGLANDFSLDDVLWAQAGGLCELWKPDEALENIQRNG